MTRRRCASCAVRKGPARTLCYVSTFFRCRELIISGRAHRLVDLVLHRRQGFPIGQVATQCLMNFRPQNGLDQSELWRRRARKRFQQVPFGQFIDHADDRRRGRSRAKRHKARRSARIGSSAMRGKPARMPSCRPSASNFALAQFWRRGGSCVANQSRSEPSLTSASSFDAGRRAIPRYTTSIAFARLRRRYKARPQHRIWPGVFRARIGPEAWSNCGPIDELALLSCRWKL